MHTHTCENCTKTFQAMPKRKRFCSNDCYWAYGQRPDVCLARFWAQVKKTRTCWLWTGQLDTAGYGNVALAKVRWGSHRFSWTLVNGPIPKGMEIMHTCDTPACVRPEHLRLGTHADNMRDCTEKGRKPTLLTPDAVREIRAAVAPHQGRRRLPEGLKQALADKHGVSKHTIYHVVSGRNWKHVA